MVLLYDYAPALNAVLATEFCPWQDGKSWNNHLIALVWTPANLFPHLKKMLTGNHYDAECCPTIDCFPALKTQTSVTGLLEELVCSQRDGTKVFTKEESSLEKE